MKYFANTCTFKNNSTYLSSKRIGNSGDRRSFLVETDVRCIRILGRQQVHQRRQPRSILTPRRKAAEEIKPDGVYVCDHLNFRIANSLIHGDAMAATAAAAVCDSGARQQNTFA